MRVVHLASQYPPHTLGGLGTHVAGLTRRISAAWEVIVAAPGAADSAAPRGVSLPLEWSTEDGRRETVRLLLPLCRHAVLHVHNHEPAEVALTLARECGCTLVTTLHLPAPPVRAGVEQELLQRSRAVIAVSHWLAKLYPRIHAVVIPNGVDTAFWTPGTTARDPERLLLVGRLVPQKGIETALRALAEVGVERRGLRLRIAGEGAWRQAYRNLARDLGVVRRVEWLGWQEPAALREEYRRAALLLMPSRMEPFGLVALEAMACGCAVVATTNGGTSEFIDSGRSGVLLPPDDLSAWTEALQRLLGDARARDRLGLAGHAAAATMDWSRIAARTECLYREAVARVAA